MTTNEKRGSNYANPEAEAKRLAQYEYLMGFESLFHNALVERRMLAANEPFVNWRTYSSFARAHGAITIHLFDAEHRNFSFRIKCAWDYDTVNVICDKITGVLATVADRSPESAELLFKVILDEVFNPNK